jgi:hypothetical protein
VRAAGRFTAKLMLTGAALGALAGFFGDRLEHAVLPWFKLVIAAIDRDHRVESLALVRLAAGPTVQLVVSRQRWVVVGARALEPDARARATAQTRSGNIRLAVVLSAAAALAAWPWRRRGWLLRLVLLPLPVALALAADIPVLLVGEIHRLYLGAFDHAGWSVATLWSDLLLGGARYVLPLVWGAGLAWLIEAARLSRAAPGGAPDGRH